MASVDSGVETENDSNDSSVAGGQENRRSMDLSPASSLRDSRSASENSFFSSRDPVPSTSQQDAHPSFMPLSNGGLLQAGVVPCLLKLEEDGLLKLKSYFNLETTSKPIEISKPVDEQADDSASTGDDAAEMQEVEPPAGLSFENIKSTGNKGYEIADDTIILRSYSKHTLLQAKMRRPWLSRYHTQNRFPEAKYTKERSLRRAASTNHVEMVSYLLDKGVNPNATDEFKRAPLHLAACRGFIDTLELLLDKGANPNQKDSMGNTALHLAACTNNVPVVTLLLKAGTDVSSLDQYGRNPLQLAQTRLKMLQMSAAMNPDAMQVKCEVQNVIDMMQIYLHRIGSHNRDAENELLNSFSTRLTLSQTPKEVDHELRGLLASLSNLNLNKAAPTASLESIDV
ncbi:Hypothetical predicted protein [Cloeon dipterum]|uniref:Ankyrin repeat domain-containing protein 54 n=1 Tax=Cloeon dipterum TaxID=197152 RepID=A0A8S1CSL8_9INSE|nr:Hypothetical predicted protein [Cloeon dipterum]